MPSNIRLIHVSKGIPEKFVNMVLGTLATALDRIKDEDEHYIELYIYRDEYEYMSISGLEHPNIYFVMHEAYLGWPRIHIIHSLCRGIQRVVLEAGLIHEAIHAAIHGSPKYYIMTPPEAFRDSCLSKHDPIICSSIYNLLASGVKDYEVSRAAVEYGLETRVKPLIYKYLMEAYRDVVDEDNLSNEPIKLCNVIKQFLAAYPLALDKNISGMIRKLIDALRERHAINLKEIIDMVERFGDDTYKNISYVLDWFTDRFLI